MQETMCPFCLNPVQDETCPFCGRPVNYAGHLTHLPVGYTLYGRSTYVLGAALGQGGFGITYIALDPENGCRVAIKEYYPSHCCTRDSAAIVHSGYGQEETYNKGKQHFLMEAQMLQSLSDLPSVVKVLDYFEANNSAYLVMEYLDGLSLKDNVETNGKLPAQQFLNQLKLLMADMEKMHQRGVVHRDIAPDNIILLPDGRLKLIDFGAARSYVGDKSMTVVVKKGFAPVEQYMRKGSNASTDVYALAATIYYCITGIVPPDSAERQYGDAQLQAPTSLGVELSREQERALEKALEIQPKARTQSVAELENMLSRAPASRKAKVKPQESDHSRVKINESVNTHSASDGATLTHLKNAKLWLSVLAVGFLLVLTSLLVISFGNKALRRPPAETTKPSIPQVSVTEPHSDAPDSEISIRDYAGTTISLWTFPIGSWGSQETVDALMAQFEADTGIQVTVEYLTYADGDDKINTAIEAGAAPDLIMEGPERLVANWGAKGKMVNIADLYDDTDRAEIYPAALAACFADENTAYEYPLVMTAHCMAINKTVFEAAGAMKYINEDTHTWKSVADFEAAVDAVYAYTGSTVGIIFCGGQGGDQGTRALVNNLRGGTFTNSEHTAYTWDSAENIAALKTLYDNPAIIYDSRIVGGDEINLFYNGTLNMAFCWNIAQQLRPNSANTGAEKTLNGDDIMFMAFPSDATAQLCGGIWGFGILDNGDTAKIEASKIFIRYFCDSEKTAAAVRAANYFAVRSTAEGADLSTIWADNAVMTEYNILMPLLGDYYQVTPSWAAARTAWWNMLQQVGASDGSVEAITAAVKTYVNQANGK